MEARRQCNDILSALKKKKKQQPINVALVVKNLPVNAGDVRDKKMVSMSKTADFTVK